VARAAAARAAAAAAIALGPWSTGHHTLLGSTVLLNQQQQQRQQQQQAPKHASSSSSSSSSALRPPAAATAATTTTASLPPLPPPLPNNNTTSWLLRALQPGPLTSEQIGAPAVAPGVFSVPVDAELKAARFTPFSVARPHARAFHLSWLALCSAFFSTFSPAALLPLARDGLDLARRDLGNAAAASVVGAAAARVLMGALVDVAGPRRATGVALLLTAPAVFCTALVDSAGGFVAARMLAGMSLSMFVVDQAWMTAMFSTRVVATASAFSAGWGNAGGGLAPVAMPLLAQGIDQLLGGGAAHVAWRWALLVPGVLQTITGVMALLLADDSPQAALPSLAAAAEKRRQQQQQTRRRRRRQEEEAEADEEEEEEEDEETAAAAATNQSGLNVEEANAAKVAPLAPHGAAAAPAPPSQRRPDAANNPGQRGADWWVRAAQAAREATAQEQARAARGRAVGLGSLRAFGAAAGGSSGHQRAMLPPPPYPRRHAAQPPPPPPPPATPDAAAAALAALSSSPLQPAPASFSASAAAAAAAALAVGALPPGLPTALPAATAATNGNGGGKNAASSGRRARRPSFSSMVGGKGNGNGRGITAGSATGCCPPRCASPSLSSPSWRGLAVGASNPRTWLLALAYALSFGAEVTCYNILPSYAFDHFGLSLFNAGLLAAASGLGNIVTRAVGGAASDACSRAAGMRGRLWLMWLSIAASGVASLLFGLAHDSLALTVAALVGFSAAAQVACGAVFGVVPFVSRRSNGVVVGIVSAGGTAGGALMQAALFGGLLSPARTDGAGDAPGFYMGFYWLGAAILVASASCVLIIFPMWGSMFAPPMRADDDGGGREGGKGGSGGKGGGKGGGGGTRPARLLDEEAYYLREYTPAERAAGLHVDALRFAHEARSERAPGGGGGGGGCLGRSGRGGARGGGGGEGGGDPNATAAAAAAAGAPDDELVV
jgi:nitrate/nitrite transporter NarK